MAQLVERHLAKVEVAGSTPVARSYNVQVWRQWLRDLCFTRSTALNASMIFTWLRSSQEDLVMLVELSMIEQRYQAVCSTSKLAVTDVCHPISRGSSNLHRWSSTMPITA